MHVACRARVLTSSEVKRNQFNDDVDQYGSIATKRRETIKIYRVMRMLLNNQAYRKIHQH